MLEVGTGPPTHAQSMRLVDLSVGRQLAMLGHQRMSHQWALPRRAVWCGRAMDLLLVLPYLFQKGMTRSATSFLSDASPDGLCALSLSYNMHIFVRLSVCASADTQRFCLSFICARSTFC